MKFFVGFWFFVCNVFKGFLSSFEILMKYEEWGGSENFFFGSNLVKNNFWRLKYLYGIFIFDILV